MYIEGMNNTVTIKIESPLLRPGLSLETKVSVKYTEKAVAAMMEIVRAINATIPTDVSSVSKA